MALLGSLSSEGGAWGQFADLEYMGSESPPQIDPVRLHVAEQRRVR